MAKIKVQNTEVTVITYNDKDYISLTDMVRNMENGPALIEKWLRNKNTVEFLGIWEEMYNPDFNSPEFEGIKNFWAYGRRCTIRILIPPNSRELKTRPD